MFQRKQRRFRRRTNGKNNMPHGNGSSHNRLRSSLFSNIQSRNNFRNFQSPEKLFEKYNSLAKEAMSSGDKTLCENYLQHADHFMRIIEDRNKNRNQNKSNVAENSIENEKQISEKVDGIKDAQPQPKDKD